MEYASPPTALPLLRQQVEQALHACINEARCTTPDSPEQLQIHAIFDREQDHYLLIAEGWRGFRRIYRTLVHIALRNECCHIYEDATVAGIAEGLHRIGVPDHQIICAFRNAPTNR